MRYIVAGFLACSGIVAAAAPQPVAGASATNAPERAIADDADYALELKDPFSPIGYQPPLAEGQLSAAGKTSPDAIDRPPPSLDIKAKAKSILRVLGILKRGNAYVANINGTIVRAGDSVSVTVDGQTVVFVIRSISLKQIQIEPQD